MAPRRPPRPRLPERLSLMAEQAMRVALSVWGRQGARARAAALTKAERSAIARKGAEARWGTRRPAEAKTPIASPGTTETQRCVSVPPERTAPAASERTPTPKRPRRPAKKRP